MTKTDSEEFRTLAEVKQEYIQRVLAAVKNKTQAAKILGIDRRTLYRIRGRKERGSK